MHLKEWILLLLTVIVTVIFYAATPTLTAMNIAFIANNREDMKWGVGLFLLTFLANFANRIATSQSNYGFRTFGIRLSNVVTMLIYNKSLKYSPMGDKSFSEA